MRAAAPLIAVMLAACTSEHERDGLHAQPGVVDAEVVVAAPDEPASPPHIGAEPADAGALASRADGGPERGDAAPTCPTVLGAADASADAALEPIRPDPASERAFWAAKAVCDSTHRWFCGELYLTVDERGCATGFSARQDELPAGYAACIVSELAGMCTPCLASREWFFFDSCTLH